MTHGTHHQKHHHARSLVIGLLLALALFSLGILTGLSTQTVHAPDLDTFTSSETSTATVTLMIDFEDGNLQTFQNIAWHEGETVYDVLKIASERGLFVTTKDYGGDMGVFIQAIGGKAGSGERFWQYWVNNVYGSKGASTSIVKPGDNIEWKLIRTQI